MATVIMQADFGKHAPRFVATASFVLGCVLQTSYAALEFAVSAEADADVVIADPIPADQTVTLELHSNILLRSLNRIGHIAFMAMLILGTDRDREQTMVRDESWPRVIGPSTTGVYLTDEGWVKGAPSMVDHMVFYGGMKVQNPADPYSEYRTRNVNAIVNIEDADTDFTGSIVRLIGKLDAMGYERGKCGILLLSPFADMRTGDLRFTVDSGFDPPTQALLNTIFLLRSLTSGYDGLFVFSCGTHSHVLEVSR